jgi:hypothetical protein
MKLASKRTPKGTSERCISRDPHEIALCSKPPRNYQAVLSVILTGDSSWYREEEDDDGNLMVHCKVCEEILYREYPEVTLLELKRNIL